MKNIILSSFIYIYTSTILTLTHAKNIFDCHVPSQKKDKRSRLFYQGRETLRFNIIDFDSSQMLELNRLIMKLRIVFI